MRTRIQEWLLEQLGWAIPVPGSLTLLVVAVIVGIYVTVREGRRRGLSTDLVTGNLAWLIAFGFAGSRVFFWAEHAGLPGAPPLFSFWEGGLSLYGAVLGAAVGAIVASRFGDRQWMETLDGCLPGFAVGLVIGRIGCFLNGCDFGVTTALPWAVRYPPGSAAYELHVATGLVDAGDRLSAPVHPTQLYEAAFGLLLLAIVALAPWRKLHPSSAILSAVAAYSIFRFGIEALREPTAALVAGVLTVGQTWSVVVLALAVGLALARRSTPQTIDGSPLTNTS